MDFSKYNSNISVDGFFKNLKIDSDEKLKVDCDKDDQDLHTIKTDGNVSIGSTTPDYKLDTQGYIKVGGNSYDEEKQKELQKLSEKQFEKVKKLKDHIIEYLSENNIGYSQTKQWKSDLEKINEMKRHLEKDEELIVFAPKNANILDPEEMEELNEIYERWS